jgi:hypothetical protein
VRQTTIRNQNIGGEMVCSVVCRTGLAEDRDKWRALVNVVMNLPIPYSARKLSSGYTARGFSTSSQLQRVRLNSVRVSNFSYN